MIKATPRLSLSQSPSSSLSLTTPANPVYGLGLPFIQGPPGENGRDGRDGIDGISPAPFSGFGQITYAHTPSGPGDPIEPNTPTPIVFASDTPQDKLLGPFVGHAFWDGTKIIPRAMNDLVEVQVNLQVTSLISGGFLQIYLDAQSPLGPIVSSTATLFADANTMERVTLLLNFQVLSNLMANGGQIMARSTVPLRINRESLLFMPRSTQG